MEEKSRMYDALAEPGSSVTDVAQKFGVSYTTAWKWNEKFNKRSVEGGLHAARGLDPAPKHGGTVQALGSAQCAGG